MVALEIAAVLAASCGLVFLLPTLAGLQWDLAFAVYIVLCGGVGVLTAARRRYIRHHPEGQLRFSYLSIALLVVLLALVLVLYHLMSNPAEAVAVYRYILG